MELAIVDQEDDIIVSNYSETEKSFIGEFNEFCDVLQLSTVYQLNVDKARQGLETLKKSLAALSTEKASSNDNNDNSVVCLRDQLEGLSEEFLCKSAFDGSMSVSSLMIETCGLICRLEVDRKAVEAEIIKQKAQVDEILHKIESLAFFRMEEMPAAVQREHEACANDISELQWFIKHRRRLEKKLRQRRNNAFSINERLKEEIGRINSHIPLVQDKLKLEEEMMVLIEKTKDELTKECQTTKGNLQFTQEKHGESKKKVDVERQHIRKDLHKTNKSLAHTQKSLQHATKEHEKLNNYISRSKDKIQKNYLQINKLNQDVDGKSREKFSLDEAVNGLEIKYKEAQFDNKRLIDNRNGKSEEYKNIKDEQTNFMDKRQQQRDETDQKLTVLKRDNRQMEIEIDSLKKSSEKCVEDAQKYRDRSARTMEETKEAEKNFELSVNDFSKVSKIHSNIRLKLVEETRKIQEAEDKVRQNITNLENQIKKEIMSKASFKTRIETDSGDLEKMKKEILVKEIQTKKTVEETQNSLKDMQQKYEKIAKEHQETSRQLDDHQKKHDLIVGKLEKMRGEKKVIIDELTPVHKELSVKLDDLIKKEEYVQWQVQTMNSQLVETSASESMVNKAKKKIQEGLLDVEKSYNGLTIDLDIIRKRQDRLNDQISKLSSQSDRMKGTHVRYMSSREEDFRTAEKELEESLALNRRLAKHYRSLQTDFYKMQDAYLDVLQEHLWGKAKIENIKEVQRLQKHMHSSLQTFHLVKLIYDDEEFMDLQSISGLNSKDVQELRRKYKQCVNQLQSFVMETFPENVSQLQIASYGIAEE